MAVGDVHIISPRTVITAQGVYVLKKNNLRADGPSIVSGCHDPRLQEEIYSGPISFLRDKRHDVALQQWQKLYSFEGW